MNDFELASGTTMGLDHVRLGTNNQDGYAIIKNDNYTIAVVCDGCSTNSEGQSSHNEVGALLGARIVAREFARQLDFASFYTETLATVRGYILDALRPLLPYLGGNNYTANGRRKLAQNVSDFFLFTIVAAIITEEITVFVHIGDGTLIVNGVQIPLGPYPDNRPPYVAYKLVESEIAPELLDFRIAEKLPTRELQNFLIGSDGVQDLINAYDRLIPGRDELIGVIDQFWTDDTYFGPFNLGRRLTIINGGVAHRTPRGPLHDDTTLIVGRRYNV